MPRHVFRFCPRCTTKLVRRDDHGSPRPTCPNCGYIHYRNPAPAAGVILMRGRDVLMVKRRYHPRAGAWCLPAGFLEYGETPEHCAVRELREETGLDGACGDFIGWVERIEGDDHFVILDFEVVVFEPTAGQAGDDAAEVAWVPLNDVAEQPLLVDGLAEFLHEHNVIRTIT